MHFDVGVFDFILQQTQRHDLAVIRRRKDQISRVERDTLDWRVNLEYLPFEQLLQLNRVQDYYDSGLKAKHDVTIVVWAILKRSYATL